MRSTPNKNVITRFPLEVNQHRRHAPHLSPIRESTAEERLRLLLYVAHIIPWEADFETSTFTYVGQPAERALGYPISEWYEPKFWETHLHPEDSERALADCEQRSRDCNYYEL